MCCGMLQHASKPPPTGPKNRCCSMPWHASTVGAVWTPLIYILGTCTNLPEHGQELRDARQQDQLRVQRVE